MNPTLKRGDQGGTVRQLQLLLVRRSGARLKLAPDGRFGPATEAAVRAFQGKHKLSDDGVVGLKTWLALGVVRPSPPAPVQHADTGQPRDWMAIAQAELGVAEIAGRDANPRIIEYHATVAGTPRSDETAWCSSFVNWVMLQAGYRGTNSAAARSWLRWGTELAVPREGAIMVTHHDGAEVANGTRSGDHVAFYVSGNNDTFRILGGNQSNSVSVGTRRYASYVRWSYRWPA